MDLARDDLLKAYRTMRMIRDFEEKLFELVNSGDLAGFLHLYAGEEAVAAGVCAHLSPTDFVTTTHRGHGHCIAKGVDVNGMMAELFGKSTGICKGKGGSMHIADLDCGMLGANGIVGSSIPLATGAALTAMTKKTGGVAVAFFGDGASNQGQFHEAVNLAAVWKLPVVFTIENNGYGEATPTEFVTPTEDLAVRAIAYGIPGIVVDGMDFFDVYEKAGEAIARARAGDGPSILECKTYRYFGHYVGDNLAYRTQEEADEVRRTNDCLDRMEARLLERDDIIEGELRAVDEEVSVVIEAAVQAAKEAPVPTESDLLADVYAGE